MGNGTLATLLQVSKQPHFQDFSTIPDVNVATGRVCSGKNKGAWKAKHPHAPECRSNLRAYWTLTKMITITYNASDSMKTRPRIIAV
jgi:hypothetical protein